MGVSGSGHGSFAMWVDTSELQAFGSKLGKAGVRVGARGAQIVRAGAHKMERRMKATSKVDTGAMKNSVSSSIVGDGRATSILAEVGPSVDYAVYVNNGTSRMAGDDFVGRAFDAEIGGIMAAVGQLEREVLP